MANREHERVKVQGLNGKIRTPKNIGAVWRRENIRVKCYH
jgi:hypothetical protein